VRIARGGDLFSGYVALVTLWVSILLFTSERQLPREYSVWKEQVKVMTREMRTKPKKVPWALGNWQFVWEAPFSGWCVALAATTLWVSPLRYDFHMSLVRAWDVRKEQVKMMVHEKQQVWKQFSGKVSFSKKCLALVATLRVSLSISKTYEIHLGEYLPSKQKWWRRRWKDVLG